LGGARTHTELSAVAHYRVANDAECLQRIRHYIGRLPRHEGMQHRLLPARPPARPPADLYGILPQDHRMSYDMRHLLACLLDDGVLDEFQPDLAKEMICGHARIEGWPVALIANQRGVVKGRPGERPRFGGIIYAESAEKVAYFIETASRERLPLLFVQDVSGFMVGPEAEQEGIIRAGARWVEAMATAVVPKLVLTVNHASGAGYYAMAGQGFDPDFILSWPTGRMGVMEGESAVMAVHGPDVEKAQQSGRPLPPQKQAAIETMRADYEHQLDARFAAARGFVDAIVAPEDTRDQLAFLLRVSANYGGPHVGPFVLPPLDAASR
ncbi:MAG TPA: carboxyl transferase domain-containing protein, partial [Gemmatimonadales bacterium]|nr:carboxyl transferase domain-containing protein [Gemmatimonadales bacterium]